MIQYFSPIFWNLLLFWSRGKIDKGILKRLERVANSPSSSSLKNTFKEAPKLSGTGTSLSWRSSLKSHILGLKIRNLQISFAFHHIFNCHNLRGNPRIADANVPTGLLRKRSGALRPHHKDMSQRILPKYLEKKRCFQSPYRPYLHFCLRRLKHLLLIPRFLDPNHPARHDWLPFVHRQEVKFFAKFCHLPWSMPDQSLINLKHSIFLGSSI